MLHALSRAATLAGTALLLHPFAGAQGPGEVSGTAVFAGMIAPEPPFTGYSPDAPMPPKVLFGRVSAHVDPPIPVGPARPGPNTPPSQVIDPAVVDTGVFRYFQLEDVKPTGASTSVVGEPSAAVTDHVAFQTGNWYGARSVDNGSSWEHVNPYTFFPSVDGGFCCDQRIVYVPSHDITVWVLQYVYSSTTQTAGYRIAVANGDADLANPSASAWTSYVLRPQTFGFANATWFDFPDIAFSDAGFYLSANVYNASDAYQGTAIIRTTLDGLQANGSIPLSYINSITHGVEFTPRMAQGGSPGDRIFWCSLENTSTVQVGWFSDANTYSRVSRAVGTVSQTISSTPSPDGVNWATRAPTRFRGAYGNSTEVGFLFTSGSTGASRPVPFLRVMRFTADNNRSLIAEHDIWSSSTAFTYGAAGTNSLGDVGIVAAVGSGSSYVHSSATIIDSYQPWGGLTFVSMGAGQDSPNQNRWGDYFEVRRSHDHPRTFVGTGMRQIGGSANSQNTPQFAWFGRDDYEPTWVNLNVQAAGLALGNIGITVEQTDMDGNKDGTTSFNRRFAPSQPYTLTAPATVTQLRNVYVFDRWTYQVQPGAGFNNAPVGETTLALSSIGGLDDVAIANYKLRRTLTVQSTNPSSGVSITVSPADIGNEGNGSTSFTRYYRDDEVVSLTAPASVGFNDFRYWTVNGAIVIGGRAINVTMDGSKTAVAVYWNNVAGSYSTIGSGCVGSNGLTPNHSITWPAGQQGPQQGAVTNYRLSSARPFAAVALNVGLSRTLFNGLPLPLDLSVIGVTGGCFLRHDIVSSQSLATDASGFVTFPVTWPQSPSSIGVPIYSSYIVIDPGNGRPTPLTISNAREVRMGGNQ